MKREISVIDSADPTIALRGLVRVKPTTSEHKEKTEKTFLDSVKAWAREILQFERV